MRSFSIGNDVVAIAVALALSLSTSSALAQDQAPTQDKVLAQSLFEEGRRLMGEKRYDEACPKLLESQRIDPGGGTLLNLALCYEQQGKTATAWVTFKEALAMARREAHAERETFANKRIAALEPRLSRLTVVVSEPPEGLTVTRNGSPIPPSTWGMPVPLDPGEHALVATAPGYAQWEGRVVVGPESDQQHVTVPPLTAVAAEAPPPLGLPAPTPPMPPSPMPSPSTAAHHDDGEGDGQRVAGFVIGGVGLAATIVGAAFGGVALSKKSDSDSLCGAELCPNDTSGQQAVALHDDASTFAKLSNGFLFGGLGLVAVGVVVTLTAPSGSESEQLSLRTEVLPGGGAVVFGGSF